MQDTQPMVSLQMHTSGYVVLVYDCGSGADVPLPSTVRAGCAAGHVHSEAVQTRAQ